MVFVISHISINDQQDKTEEMREKVVEDVIVEQLPKESDEGFRLRIFEDLFKKLPIADRAECFPVQCCKDIQASSAI